MKRSMMMLLAAFAFAVCTTGCTSIVRCSSGSNQPTGLERGYKLNWDVKNQKVSQTAKVGRFLIFPFGFKPSCSSDLGRFQYAENAALYEACKKEGCDKLVGTTYETKRFNFLWLYVTETSTVKGFPATLKGVTAE